MTRHKHILVLGGLARSLVNFRGPLIRQLLSEGYRVTASAGDDDPFVRAKIAEWGGEFRHVPLSRAGLNPLADLKTLLSLVWLMRATKPDIFFGYTIKPVTFGLIAARIAGVRRRFAMITGLGYAFTEGSGLKRRLMHFIAGTLYRRSLRYADAVIFQNRDDEAYFFDHGLLRSGARTARVSGSGVDLEHFRPVPLPSGPITFLMIARLLRDKGVVEYVEAARRVKRLHPDVRFVLVGPLDPNPAAIQKAEVDAWIAEGAIEYCGEVDDVRPYITACHVYVLPSYREGMPRTVLEAMAMGRGVITTDTAGCRETVIEGKNGLLVPVCDALALSNAMLVAIKNSNIARWSIESLALAGKDFSAAAVACEMTGVFKGRD